MAATILLVDDEEGIRTVMGISLADSGHQVFTAADGAAALQMLETVAPEIVLADIKMPGMDGIELLRAIKRQRPETEVIMITGHGDIDLAIRSLKADATDFITKPIHEDILDAALRRAEERIRMRRQLRRYTENLEQLVAEKTGRLLEAERLAAMGETIAGLSHTIKNIAGGLKGGAFVLEKGIELDERQYLMQGWEMIKSNVDKIRALSMDLLDYGKLGCIARRPCDPCQPAREVVELMQKAAGAGGVELRLEVAPTPGRAMLDPDALHRCLLNLVTNALDACQPGESPAGNGVVAVACCPSPGGGVIYRVSDNGCGMSGEVQANLFRTFFSTKGSRGTGIGLMMTRRIVDQHGGTVTFDSTPGVGTTFTINIPPDHQTAVSAED